MYRCFERDKTNGYYLVDIFRKINLTIYTNRFYAINFFVFLCYPKIAMSGFGFQSIKNNVIMLIAGIRHKISSELDVHRSATFMRYLLHYLAMFAFLGVIIPILIGVDYFCNPQTENDVITKKQVQIVDDMNHIEYHISTKLHKFLSDVVFYENIRIGTQVVFLSTPILNMVTNVSFCTEKGVYKCDPNNVYGWMLIIVGVTFVISIIFVLETQNSMRRYKHVKYNSVINIGIFNVFLSIFTIVAVMFHIFY